MVLAEVAGLALAFVARLITGAQGHWRGCAPKAEQRIYFANHQSHLDWVLIWAALPRDLRTHTRPIAARDYWTSSRFKQWLTSAVFNAVYVNRQRTDDQDPLEPLAAALERGDSLVIFPEGTRSSAGEPMPFKSGLYHLAQKFPQAVHILCSVTFGTPVALGAEEDKRDFLERARAAVLGLRPRSA
jgi:1-acyl-sn-glycerol-3-phosphate acyltransferase